MAKKQNGVDNIFKSTEPGPGQLSGEADHSDLNRGKITPMGFGLREGEIEALQEIADSLGVARNAVGRHALRWFIMQYRAGNVNLSGFVEQPPTPKKVLRMPGEE